MAHPTEPLPSHLAEPTRLGNEISITGKWVPKKQGGRFRKTAESMEMLQEWEDIHAGARADTGVLSTEINHAVGEDAVLVHHVFRDGDALVDYFSTTATQHMGALFGVARPELHLIRGTNIPEAARRALLDKDVPAVFGEHLFGYAKRDYKRPDQETSIQVSAKWTCSPSEASHLDELKYWWQRVGTDAYSIEEGLLRFEAYEVVGEDALIMTTDRLSDPTMQGLMMSKHRQYATDVLPDDPAVLRRARYLLRISDALRTTYPLNPRMSGRWVRQGHRRFGRRSPLSIILRDGESGLIAVLSELDCTFSWDLTGSKPMGYRPTDA